MKFHLSSNNIPISTSSDVYICLQDIWLIRCGAKELNVNFIMVSGVVLVVWKLQFTKKIQKKGDQNLNLKEEIQFLTLSEVVD